jgi:hypothetical protein
MKIMPMGDYYLWYCEWCDSRNMTLWTRVMENRVQCSACHRQFRPLDQERTEERMQLVYV